jgi:hypothetical protein
MKRIIILALCVTAIVSFTHPVKPKTINLFNGKDLRNWHADIPALDSNTSLKSPFIIRNGMLVSLGKPGGHLITNAVYTNLLL